METNGPGGQFGHRMPTPGDVDMYDKVPIVDVSAKKVNPMQNLIENAKAGVENFKEKKSRFQFLPSKLRGEGWTAQGINDFQKTLFPIAFLLFTLLFSLCTYYKVGDIEQNEEF